MSGGESEVFEPSLNPAIFELSSLRWIFVGGKGGVGKTTTACSIAVELSKLRESVLILSTDPAHNLSDAFGQKFGNAPTQVNGFTNLFAMEVKSKMYESPSFNIPGAEELGSALSSVLPDLLSAFPGIDEAFGFAELMHSVRSLQFTTVVFDTAPTGHTLRLISFPEVLHKALGKLTSWREKLPTALGFMSSMSGGLIDEEEIYSKLDALYAATSSVKEQFEDPARTTFVCVCIPEFLSIFETERLIQELAKHKIDCSSVVVNQVLFPIDEEQELSEVALESALEIAKEIKEGEEDSRLTVLAQSYCKLYEKAESLEKNFMSRRKMQSKYLLQVQELYASDFHVVTMPLQSREVRGISDLTAFAKLLRTPKNMPILTSS